MKKTLEIVIVSLMVIVPSVFSGCGGGGGYESNWSMPDNSVTIGPAGGELSLSHWSLDGVRVVVPPGVLTEERSFELKKKFYLTIPSLPAGFIPYSSKEDNFEIIVSGDEIYDLGLQLHFPIKDMTITSPNEKACAFAYDRRLSKWIIVLPDAIDDSIMTVDALYRDYWMWGKIDMDTVKDEYLIGGVKEKYGVAMWDSAILGIITAVDVLGTLYVDRTCETWTRLRDDDLPKIIKSQGEALLSYQSKLGDSCGDCDLLSTQFGSELSKYMMAKLAILSSNIWEFYTGWTGGYLPFFSNIDQMMSIQRYLAISFIESQDCNISCVGKELGLGVYTTYSTHWIYLVTYYIVYLTIEGAFPNLVSCP